MSREIRQHVLRCERIVRSFGPASLRGGGFGSGALRLLGGGCELRRKLIPLEAKGVKL